MAPLQLRLRKAIGLLKDQTSISIAKVASVGTPDLEIAIVKATSHEESASEERYVQVVLHLTSFSRAYVNACVCSISRRLSKTCNWIVAIKALILAHRLLRDGDAAFEKELMLSRKQGMCVLNVSDFRDDSHTHGWDFSAFVHAYGLYLDDRLDCSMGSFGARPKQEGRRSFKGSSYEYSDSVHHNFGDGSPPHCLEKRQSKERSRSVKDMKPDELIENLPAFQCLLQRVVACRPTGPAKANRLTNVALYAVIRESFVLYADLRDGLAILQEAYFDMELWDCDKVLDIYTRAAKQMDELISFYSFCEGLGVCRTAEYPSVEAIPIELLERMEKFARDPNRDSRSRGPEPVSQVPENKSGENLAKDTKAVHVAPKAAEESSAPLKIKDVNLSTDPVSNVNGDLVDVCEPILSPEEHGDKLALALFSGTQTKPKVKWDAFPEQGSSTTVATAASWELALIESESELSKPNGSTLAGGFDNLLLDSLYEYGADRQKMLTVPSGSTSSVALVGQPHSTMLALPAPPLAGIAGSNDPFTASDGVPRPAYVQMSEMWQKQQLLVQEQQQWLQYQQGGMQGYVGFGKYPNNPFAGPFQPTVHPVLYHNSNPFYG